MSLKVFDIRCHDCGEVSEVWKESFEVVVACSHCLSYATETLPPMSKVLHKKQPYDYLGRIPDSKPIKSFANDRRKGGKDTT